MVSVWNIEEPNINTIYLGHIDEEHYIPIIKIDDDISQNILIMNEFKNNYPRYITAKNKYHKWAKKMQLLKNTVKNNYDPYYNFDEYYNY